MFLIALFCFRDVDWTKVGSWRTGEGDDLHSNHTIDSIWRVWSSQALIRSDLTIRNICLHICICWFSCVYVYLFTRHLQCCTVTWHTYIDLNVYYMTYVCAIAGCVHSLRFHAMFYMRNYCHIWKLKDWSPKKGSPQRKSVSHLQNFVRKNVVDSSHGCFLKWWYPTTMSFPTKNHHFGMFWGYHHLSKHPHFHLQTAALFVFFRVTFVGTLPRFQDQWGIPVSRCGKVVGKVLCFSSTKLSIFANENNMFMRKLQKPLWIRSCLGACQWHLKQRPSLSNVS